MPSIRGRKMRVVQADAHGLEEAASLLLAGGVAVIPTDTVYGLAAHPGFPQAVQRLYDIKRRDAKKPIALLASDAAGVESFLGSLSEASRRLAKRWPGALTLVLPSAAGGTEGVRVPNHAWTRELLKRCGGVLRVTSANLSGEVAATEACEAFSKVGLSADLVVDDGRSPGGVASTVLRVDGDGALTLLRPGPVQILTLASGSPRRAKILRAHRVDFVVAKSSVAEVSYDDDPVRTVRENALRKGAGVTAAGPVLSADTIVWHKGRIYGKPRDLDEAKSFLRTLGGETHQVLTAVAYQGEVRVETSDVTFKPLSEREIEDYVAQVRPLDRAGAYDVDESGERLVASYTGSYENIMGLPLAPLRAWGLLEEEGACS